MMMSSDIEELVREGMLQFTETMRVSPDLAASTFNRYRHWRQLRRASLALGTTGAVAAAAGIAVAAHGPATSATTKAMPELRAHLLSAIESARGDILYTRPPGKPLSGGQYPAFPRPGQKVRVRIGPAVGSDGKIYKDGEYTFKMPTANPAKNYTSNLDQGGLRLSGRAIAVDHQTHRWRDCHAKFILGFTLDAAGIRSEIAKGQFTVIGRTKLRGQQAIELRINVPPNNEAPPHVTADRLLVNATTYLPMREYVRMSNGQHSVTDFVFLRPTPKRLANLHPAIPAGYTRVGCARSARQQPQTRHFPPAG
jgi:hypothetical protein